SENNAGDNHCRAKKKDYALRCNSPKHPSYFYEIREKAEKKEPCIHISSTQAKVTLRRETRPGSSMDLFLGLKLQTPSSDRSFRLGSIAALVFLLICSSSTVLAVFRSGKPSGNS